MEIRMNFNDFIKIKSILKIIDLSGEVIDYQIDKNEIKGIMGINGKYAKESLDETYNFNEEIPFNFIFKDNVKSVDDVDCVNLEYEVVDSRGIELSFDIRLDYELEGLVEERSETQVEPSVSEESKEVIAETPEEVTPPEVVTSLGERVEDEIEAPQEVETAKEEITKLIDKKLATTLSSKEDNLPQEESVFGGIEERKSTLRVCYFKTDAELEKVCKDNNVSINQVFKENQNLNINETRRVIINE
ncbi:MAG: hypothetical protein PUH11_07915 [Bacilli bacterium]|nr:hypothetical protein [Bacilli bacterium]MDY4052936.1 hypothetical protein [Bacilli bacterium]MDY6195552.1 hypothetical protein [Lactobacillus johnsonii]